MKYKVLFTRSYVQSCTGGRGGEEEDEEGEEEARTRLDYIEFFVHENVDFLREVAMQVTGVTSCDELPRVMELANEQRRGIPQARRHHLAEVAGRARSNQRFRSVVGRLWSRLRRNQSLAPTDEDGVTIKITTAHAVELRASPCRGENCDLPAPQELPLEQGTRRRCDGLQNSEIARMVLGTRGTARQ